MDIRLFSLIHNEKSYKRYYYEPLEKDGILRRLVFEVKNCYQRYKKAIYMPFNPRYNTQQIEGARKSKLLMLWENLVWTFKYKEVCTYYFLYGLDLKGNSPKDYMAYTEFRVIRNILNIRQRENKHTNYTFNYLVLTRDKFCFGQYAKSLGFPVPQTIALVSNGKICLLDSPDRFYNAKVLLSKNMTAFCKECTGEGGSGAFMLDINNGEISINQKKSTLDELIGRFNTHTYIIQQRVSNHPTIANISMFSKYITCGNGM